MSSSELLVTRHDSHVAEITLNRPDHMNTFNTAMAQALDQALLQLDEEPQVRVIVIGGAGKAFCAGIDITEFQGKDAMQYQAWVERMERPLITLSRMRKPVIAKVHGVAVANGMGLATAADLTIAAENAKFGLTAVKVGLNCVGPVIPVARCIGRKRALELLLYGELIKAPQAMAMGLVNRVVPAEQLADDTLQWARLLAEKSPLAVQIAKSAFYNAEDLPYEKAFNYMNEAFARLCTTADAREGIAAFFERRNPVWQQK
jgi:enoyl-CoA hydratase/carnithine racemase